MQATESDTRFTAGLEYRRTTDGMWRPTGETYAEQTANRCETEGCERRTEQGGSRRFCLTCRLTREEMAAQNTYQRARREADEMLDSYRNVERRDGNAPSLGQVTDALFFERSSGQAYRVARDALQTHLRGR